MTEVGCLHVGNEGLATCAVVHFVKQNDVAEDDECRRKYREMNRLFDVFHDKFRGRPERFAARLMMPSIDVSQTGQEIRIGADLPEGERRRNRCVPSLTTYSRLAARRGWTSETRRRRTTTSWSTTTARSCVLCGHPHSITYRP